MTHADTSVMSSRGLRDRHGLAIKGLDLDTEFDKSA